MADKIAKCPVCGSKEVYVVDQIDYEVLGMQCIDCLWDGTSDDLIYEDQPQQAGSE